MTATLNLAGNVDIIAGRHAAGVVCLLRSYARTGYRMIIAVGNRVKELLNRGAPHLELQFFENDDRFETISRC